MTTATKKQKPEVAAKIKEARFEFLAEGLTFLAGLSVKVSSNSAESGGYGISKLYGFKLAETELKGPCKAVGMGVRTEYRLFTDGVLVMHFDVGQSRTDIMGKTLYSIPEFVKLLEGPKIKSKLVDTVCSSVHAGLDTVVGLGLPTRADANRMSGVAAILRAGK